MLVFPSQLRVFISTEATDMRRSFDSLSHLVSEIICEDPYSGHLFVFFNRKRDAAKLLHWESSGYWLYYKRLEKGSFRLTVR